MKLVRHFWGRSQVYDRKAAQLEMDEKVLIDPSLQGKTREEMGLDPSPARKLDQASWAFRCSSQKLLFLG